MPQSRERKREYNRLRQRRLRGYGVLRSRRLSGEGEYEGEGVVPNRNVVPDRERENVVPWEDDARVWGMGSRQIIACMTWLAKGGYGLVFTERHYEFVNLATGEIGWGTPALAPLYEQVSTFKVIKEMEWTPLACTQGLEQRIMALEAEMARLEASLSRVEEEERR